MRSLLPNVEFGKALLLRQVSEIVEAIDRLQCVLIKPFNIVWGGMDIVKGTAILISYFYWHDMPSCLKWLSVKVQERKSGCI